MSGNGTLASDARFALVVRTTAMDAGRLFGAMVASLTALRGGVVATGVDRGAGGIVRD